MASIFVPFLKQKMVTMFEINSFKYLKISSMFFNMLAKVSHYCWVQLYKLTYFMNSSFKKEDYNNQIIYRIKIEKSKIINW